MKCAVVVSSKGGNTRAVADAVAGELAARGVELVFNGAVPLVEGAALSGASVATADAVLAGFWTDKGDCAPEMAEFLGSLGGRRVFLFGTAGFGGSAAYFDQILDRVRAHLSGDAVYLGGAMCQGKMGPGVRKRYEAMLAEHPGDERIQAMIANFDAALDHPDAEDRARIAKAACTALGI